MRIRKRFLCLSAVITAPRSPDLFSGNHNHRQQPVPPVQHQELHPNGNQHAGHDNTRPQFSDHPNQCHRLIPPCSADHTTQIGLQTSTWVSPGYCSDPNQTEIFRKLESERKIESIVADDTGCRKESIFCEDANDHDFELKGWVEGDRLIPVKKKRGSLGKRLNNDDVQDNEMIEGSMKPKPKKIHDHKLVAMSSKNTKNMKDEKRESVIIEGSRCSRVNGRGWRCSQQTLVGYSLCEHHLGKGRLRSLTNHVRGNRAHTIALKKQHAKDSDDGVDDEDDEDDDDDDDDNDNDFNDCDVESMSSVEGTKVFTKKTKIGVVKARSLSSLLSQISK